MSLPSLRVVFLTSGDSRSTRMSIEAVCELPGVVPVAVLVDTGRDSFRQRMKNLRRNVRRNGWRYLSHRMMKGLRRYTDHLATRAVLRPGEVEELLRKAFPDRCHTLADAGKKYGFAVREVGNLNGAVAIQTLQEAKADLGIVLGTRVLRATTFNVPRLGCINLHKGRVPEYRGMPPGFWEIYDGASTAGVTVHFVDAKLDTGDIVECGELDILPRDTPDTLLEKLHMKGARVLAQAVVAIQSGSGRRQAQGALAMKPRTSPTLREIAELRRRLPNWHEQSAAYVVAKNLVYLAIYYSGVYSLVRKLRRKSRAAIILYHRVNDFSGDVLTVDTHSFAAHLLTIAKYYRSITSSECVECVLKQRRIPPTAILIHFDDAYRDVHTNGKPILRAAGFSATAFVSSGYVNTDRQFPHDREKYTFRYENCTSSDLREWIADGFELGAHTVNHVNLGTCTLEQARMEIVESALELQKITGRRIDLFSFPFGRIQDIRQDTREVIRQAGYKAMFSAFGGFVGPGADIWDLQRFGATAGHKPLALLMEIEGLTPASMREP